MHITRALVNVPREKERKRLVHSSPSKPPLAPLLQTQKLGHSVPGTKAALGLELDLSPASQHLLPQGGLLGQLAISVGLVIKWGKRLL